MVDRNRMALNKFGRQFSKQEDYFGYAPLAIASFLGLTLFLALIFAVSIYFATYYVPLIIYGIFGLWLQTAPVNKVSRHTKTTLTNYLDLSEEEKRMLPADTQSMLIKNDWSSINIEVDKLISKVVESRQNINAPVIEDFLNDVRARSSALDDQNELSYND